MKHQKMRLGICLIKVTKRESEWNGKFAKTNAGIIYNDEEYREYYSVVMGRWEDNSSTPYNKKGWVSEIVNFFKLNCQNKE